MGEKFAADDLISVIAECIILSNGMVFFSSLVCMFICVLLHIGHDLFNILLNVIFTGDLYIWVFVCYRGMGDIWVFVSAKPSKFCRLCMTVIITAKGVGPVRRIGTDIPLHTVRKRSYGRIRFWCARHVTGNEYFRFGKVEEQYGIIPSATFYSRDAVTAVIIPAKK